MAISTQKKKWKLGKEKLTEDEEAIVQQLYQVSQVMSREQLKQRLALSSSNLIQESTANNTGFNINGFAHGNKRKSIQCLFYHI